MNMFIPLYSDKNQPQKEKKGELTVTEIIEMGKQINSDWLKGEVEKKIGNQPHPKEKKK
ncbi:MAG: hypothetical protein US54_C0010G0004 [Candidatus Roizmanbacteria bacterium GW2011_GWA2_37_7]|uniref:Uncharacterized protein n=1 Tax=Candidatus Roizmanbacteria bacterium GW2011_GWA2_37_7 TaxID=1618481 RepID=A0A0G0H570_9BACT|nr:MAG: hypothetical protein US54_C0010G0004 [Candidatus Roizmanbacteria bacterium GW2011_GWA2_37_7]